MPIPPEAVIGAAMEQVCKATQQINEDGSQWCKAVKVEGNKIKWAMECNVEDFLFWIAANCGLPFMRKPGGCE